MNRVMRALRAAARPERVPLFQSFFKTGPGEYGEGDVFLGISVPVQRAIAKRFRDATRAEVKELLASPVHEDRLTGLLILIHQYPGHEDAIYRLDVANAARINNWDLVDVSAPRIVGAYVRAHPRERRTLLRLARSRNLWERRIAIVATLGLIAHGEHDLTLAIAAILLDDKHDLIHKAVGWMLREVGKRDEKALRAFLRTHATGMPRTMLRYAIERLPDRKRLLASSRQGR